jgi:GT2 family glycosyltransferase
MTAVVIPTLNPESEMCRAAVQAVTDTAPDAEVVVEHDRERAGFAVTCNAGAARATADRLVFLNDDTLTQPGWLGPLQTALGGPESDVIAGALLTYPDGGIQHSGVFLRRRGGVLEAYNRTSPALSGEVPAVTGACIAIGRLLWDRLGGFDTEYRNGYEDVDLCLRAREAGGTVRFVAESTIVHFESRSPGRFDHVQHNVALLNERWGHLPI